MTKVTTPPASEANRQRMVHALRMRRVQMVERLSRADFSDNEALDKLRTTNDEINLLKYLREPDPDTDPEPSLEDIKERSVNWYWEFWELNEED